MGTLTIIAVLASLMAFSSLFKLAERLEEENRMLTMSIETSRIYKEALDEKVRSIREFRHDAVGLLQAIDMYAPDESADRSDNKMSGSDDGVAHPSNPGEYGKRSDGMKSRMPLLEAILELKRNQCDEAGISFVCPEEVPLQWMQEGMPDETDLCLLIQNLLDNAYEANLRISDPARRMMSLSFGGDSAGTMELSAEEARNSAGKNSAEGIRLDAERTAGHERLIGQYMEMLPAIRVRVANSIDEKEKVSFFTRKRDRELHGIGLRIVDDIVKKYHGEKTVRTDLNEHQITIDVSLKG